MSYTDDLPRACMWVSRGSAGTIVEDLKLLWERLDCLQEDQVSD